MLTFSANYVICKADRATTFAINGTKLNVSVITLSTQHNTKLLEQLKSGFKRTINWTKYQLRASTHVQNQCLKCSIDPIFQGVNRLFVLSFEDSAVRIGYREYFFPKVEIKGYNTMIDGCLIIHISRKTTR